MHDRRSVATLEACAFSSHGLLACIALMVCGSAGSIEEKQTNALDPSVERCVVPVVV